LRYNNLYIKHEPAKTSEEAAIIRNTSLESGAKAMILKLDKDFCMIVISAVLKFNNKSAKKILSTKNLRFVNVDELKNLTKCIPGAVPPFGSFFSIKTYLDKSLIDQGETISFNAGMRTRSVVMKTSDYVEIERPEIVNFI
jgi:Ala-tRNA(Pro) deacylase